MQRLEVDAVVDLKARDVLGPCADDVQRTLDQLVGTRTCSDHDRSVLRDLLESVGNSLILFLTADWLYHSFCDREVPFLTRCQRSMTNHRSVDRAMRTWLPEPSDDVIRRRQGRRLLALLGLTNLKLAKKVWYDHALLHVKPLEFISEKELICVFSHPVELRSVSKDGMHQYLAKLKMKDCDDAVVETPLKQSKADALEAYTQLAVEVICKQQFPDMDLDSSDDEDADDDDGDAAEADPEQLRVKRQHARRTQYLLDHIEEGANYVTMVKAAARSDEEAHAEPLARCIKKLFDHVKEALRKPKKFCINDGDVDKDDGWIPCDVLLRAVEEYRSSDTQWVRRCERLAECHITSGGTKFIAAMERLDMAGRMQFREHNGRQEARMLSNFAPSDKDGVFNNDYPYETLYERHQLNEGECAKAYMAEHGLPEHYWAAVQADIERLTKNGGIVLNDYADTLLMRDEMLEDIREYYQTSALVGAETGAAQGGTEKSEKQFATPTTYAKVDVKQLLEDGYVIRRLRKSELEKAQRIDEKFQLQSLRASDNRGEEQTERKVVLKLRSLEMYNALTHTSEGPVVLTHETQEIARAVVEKRQLEQQRAVQLKEETAGRVRFVGEVQERLQRAAAVGDTDEIEMDAPDEQLSANDRWRIGAIARKHNYATEEREAKFLFVPKYLERLATDVVLRNLDASVCAKEPAFNDIRNLARALCLESADTRHEANLERQEFLGDTVLNLCVAFDCLRASIAQQRWSSLWKYYQPTTENGHRPRNGCGDDKQEKEYGLLPLTKGILSKGGPHTLRVAGPEQPKAITIDDLNRKRYGDVFESLVGGVYLDPHLGMRAAHDRVRHFFLEAYAPADALYKAVGVTWSPERFPLLDVDPLPLYDELELLPKPSTATAGDRPGPGGGGGPCGSGEATNVFLAPYVRVSTLNEKEERSTHFKFVGAGSSYVRLFHNEELYARMMHMHATEKIIGFTNEHVTNLSRFAIDLDGVSADATVHGTKEALPQAVCERYVGWPLAEVLHEMVAGVVKKRGLPPQHATSVVLDITRTKPDGSVSKYSQHMHWPFLCMGAQDIEEELNAIHNTFHDEIKRVIGRISESDPEYPRRQLAELKCETSAQTCLGRATHYAKIGDDIKPLCGKCGKDERKPLQRPNDYHAALVRQHRRVWEDYVDAAVFRSRKLRMYLSDKFDEDDNKAKGFPVRQCRIQVSAAADERPKVLYEFKDKKPHDHIFAVPIPHHQMFRIASLRHPTYSRDYRHSASDEAGHWKPAGDVCDNSDDVTDTNVDKALTQNTVWITETETSEKNDDWLKYEAPLGVMIKYTNRSGRVTLWQDGEQLCNLGYASTKVEKTQCESKAKDAALRRVEPLLHKARRRQNEQQPQTRQMQVPRATRAPVSAPVPAATAQAPRATRAPVSAPVPAAAAQAPHATRAPVSAPVPAATAQAPRATRAPVSAPVPAAAAQAPHATRAPVSAPVPAATAQAPRVTDAPVSAPVPAAAAQAPHATRAPVSAPVPAAAAQAPHATRAPVSAPVPAAAAQAPRATRAPVSAPVPAAAAQAPHATRAPVSAPVPAATAQAPRVTDAPVSAPVPAAAAQTEARMQEVQGESWWKKLGRRLYACRKQRILVEVPFGLARMELFAGLVGAAQAAELAGPRKALPVYVAAKDKCVRKLKEAEGVREALTRDGTSGRVLAWTQMRELRTNKSLTWVVISVANERYAEVKGAEAVLQLAAGAAQHVLLVEPHFAGTCALPRGVARVYPTRAGGCGSLLSDPRGSVLMDRDMRLGHCLAHGLTLRVQPHVFLQSGQVEDGVREGIMRRLYDARVRRLVKAPGAPECLRELSDLHPERDGLGVVVEWLRRRRDVDWITASAVSDAVADIDRAVEAASIGATKHPPEDFLYSSPGPADATRRTLLVCGAERTGENQRQPSNLPEYADGWMLSQWDGRCTDVGVHMQRFTHVCVFVSEGERVTPELLLHIAMVLAPHGTVRVIISNKLRHNPVKGPKPGVDAADVDPMASIAGDIERNAEVECAWRRVLWRHGVDVWATPQPDDVRPVQLQRAVVV